MNKHRSWKAVGASIAAVGVGLIFLGVFFSCYVSGITAPFAIMMVLGVPCVIAGFIIPRWDNIEPENEYAVGAKLENFFDDPIDNPAWDQIEMRIRKMMDMEEEHVLLSLQQAFKGISFIQAASDGDGYDLQLGIEEAGNTRLVSKICTEKEIYDAFRKFYDQAEVDGVEQFSPVEISRKTYTAGEGKPPIWIQPIIENASMYDLDFFHFTDMLDWSKQGDDDAVLEPLVAFLAAYGDNVIFAFEDKMTELLYALDTYEIAKPLIEEEGYLSPDGFLYARCTALLNGKSYYSAVLKGKKKLSVDLEFEAILYVPMSAWKRAHQQDERDYPHKTKLSFETFSNKGGWENAPSDI